MSKIDEARDILEQLGLPLAQRNDISCLTLLALAGLSEDDPWSQSCVTRSTTSTYINVAAYGPLCSDG